MITCMMCSMMMMVVPSSRIFLMRSMASTSSEGFSPAAVSSRSRSSGRVAIARVISSRLRPAIGSALASTSLTGMRPQKSIAFSASSRALWYEFTRE
ncbi:MAG: hypothetical protein H6Q82_2923 [Deltaproteobacteria bacterium]|nr:hypothetical protein [Deltaproteobacteria bacterium]